MIDIEQINKEIAELNEYRYQLFCDLQLTDELDKNIRLKIKRLVGKKAHHKY